MTEEQILAAHIGEKRPHNDTIHLADYDAAWPALFARHADRIGSALGDRTSMIEHVGSTSVPGLAAKPTIDILLVVANRGRRLLRAADGHCGLRAPRPGTGVA